MNGIDLGAIWRAVEALEEENRELRARCEETDRALRGLIMLMAQMDAAEEEIKDD